MTTSAFRSIRRVLGYGLVLCLAAALAGFTLWRPSVSEAVARTGLPAVQTEVGGAPRPKMTTTKPRTTSQPYDDGRLPKGVTVFTTSYAGVTRMNTDFVAALQHASRDAGMPFFVESGWRSAGYQQELFDQAVRTYGSQEAAAHWVARPGTSVHEHGDAVDIAGSAASAWLARNGAAYGLCRAYANEPWHFEWRPEAIQHGCPTMYQDPTFDPRLVG